MSQRPPATAGPATPRVYTARGQVEGEDWTGVAGALNERMAARRIGQQELAQRSGVSVSTLRQLQHGAGRRVQNKTLAAISLALDWPDDHLASVLLAHRPPAQVDQPAGPDPVLDALEQVTGRLDQLIERLDDLELLIRSVSR